MTLNQALRAVTNPMWPALSKLGPASLLVLFLMALPLTARADSVGLISGATSVQVPPGQISISFIGTGAFSMNYFDPEYAGPLVSSFGFQSITQGFGSVSFNGLTTQFLTGSLSFNSSVLTGQVSGFLTLNDAVNNNPVFTVLFSGSGFSLSTSTSRSFTIATPEPASLLLLFSGLGAAWAGGRRRRREQLSDTKSRD